MRISQAPQYTILVHLCRFEVWSVHPEDRPPNSKFAKILTYNENSTVLLFLTNNIMTPKKIIRRIIKLLIENSKKYKSVSPTTVHTHQTTYNNPHWVWFGLIQGEQWIVLAKETHPPLLFFLLSRVYMQQLHMLSKYSLAHKPMPFSFLFSKFTFLFPQQFLFIFYFSTFWTLLPKTTRMPQCSVRPAVNYKPEISPLGETKIWVFWSLGLFFTMTIKLLLSSFMCQSLIDHCAEKVIKIHHLFRFYSIKLNSPFSAPGKGFGEPI